MILAIAGLTFVLATHAGVPASGNRWAVFNNEQVRVGDVRERNGRLELFDAKQNRVGTGVRTPEGRIRFYDTEQRPTNKVVPQSKPRSR